MPVTLMVLPLNVTVTSAVPLPEAWSLTLSPLLSVPPAPHTPTILPSSSLIVTDSTSTAVSQAGMPVS